MTEGIRTPDKIQSKVEIRKWLGAVFVSFAAALAILAPFFWLGTASGHDIQFHISSWLDAAGQWKEGILFPRWTEWANYGFGEPRFIFYPPFSWMLGAGLGSVLPWTWIPPVFVFTVQTFAGISAFVFFRRITLPFASALLGAAAYAANPYALLVIYARSDYAELLATAFYPLFFLYALRICAFLESDSEPRKDIFWCGILFACVWLSNAPAGVLASYSLALLLFWAALRQKSILSLVRGCFSIALGFGLAAFYLVPATYEQRWVNIASALSPGLAPSENFLFARTSDAEHDAFNRIASYIAVLMVVWTFVFLFALWRKKFDDEKPGSRQLIYVIAILAATTSLMMTRATAPLWIYLPKLRFVQFPWRWMAVLAVSFFIVIALRARRRLLLSWIVLFCTIGGTGAYLVQHVWWDSEDVNFVKDAVDSGTGFEGTDEYDPVGDDHMEIPKDQPEAELIFEVESDPAPKGEFHVERWTAEDRVVVVRAGEAASVRLKLLHHPAWQVTVNGKPVQTERTEIYNAFLVPVNAGESRIEAHFTQTFDRKIGGWLSGISVLGAALLAWPGKKKNG
ncbi:MAG TPA: hypothetical protein VEU98_11330 [Candidatus Eremiobacteraceae bacterium]|nr:hypothetical protein [Candidatus Eremiobacteraceae bacterium]